MMLRMTAAWARECFVSAQLVLDGIIGTGFEQKILLVTEMCGKPARDAEENQDWIDTVD